MSSIAYWHSSSLLSKKYCYCLAWCYQTNHSTLRYQTQVRCFYGPSWTQEILLVVRIQEDPLQQTTPQSQNCPTEICKSLGYYGRSTINKAWHAMENNESNNKFLSHYHPTLVSTPYTHVTSDPGCTINFISPSTPWNQLTSVLNGLIIGLPNGAQLQETHSALLPSRCPLTPL